MPIDLEKNIIEFTERNEIFKELRLAFLRAGNLLNETVLIFMDIMKEIKKLEEEI